MKNKLESIAFLGINFLLGIGKGTLDVLTTGLPLASVGLEFWRLNSYLNMKTKDLPWDISCEDYLSYVGSSLLGSAIPFGVKYSSEIYAFVESILE